MNQIVQCHRPEVHRERANKLIFEIGVLNKAPGSYLANHVRQLVEREDSKPAYFTNKSWDQTSDLSSLKSTAKD